MAMIVKFACLVLISIMVAAPYAEAITCGQVQGGLAPCLPYLQNGSPPVPRCCSGVKSLLSAATTTADRQTACRCLQTAAKTIKGINLGYAAGLPGKCQVNIPYQISPSTDCSKIR